MLTKEDKKWLVKLAYLACSTILDRLGFNAPDKNQYIKIYKEFQSLESE
jgi:hypothetical protein